MSPWTRRPAAAPSPSPARSPTATDAPANAATTATIADGIIGTGSLNANGPGTLTLTGTSSYSGPTTVRAGTLLADGNTGTASAAAVRGTLGGTGTFGGPV